MPIRLKFGNDLSISGSSRSAGNSISQPAGGGGFPSYGTVLGTSYGIDFETGSYVFAPTLNGFVYTQTCDVNTVADGVGGSFIDWINATNVQNKPYGLSIYLGVGISLPIGSLEVPTGSGNYIPNGEYPNSEDIHDGAGGVATQGNGLFSYYAYGTYINSYTVNNQQEVPFMSYHWEDTGTYTYYDSVHDGSGGYTNVFNSSGGSLYSNGTFIYNDGTYNYYWDGSGYYFYT